MELLIFSDNHKDKESVQKMIDHHPNVERIISLGDSEMKEFELTELNIFGVKGNYPFEPNFPKDLTFEFEGFRMFLTHGHLFSVKMGLSRLLNYGVYNNINIICFGHTHQPFLKEIQGILFLNPGSLSKQKFHNKATYAIVSIQPSNIHAVIRTLDNNIVLEYNRTR